MRLAVDFPADDALGGGNGQVAKRRPQFADGGVPFPFNVRPGPFCVVLGRLPRPRHFVLAEAVRRLARLFHNLLSGDAGLVQLLVHRRAGGRRFLARPVRRGQAFPHPLNAIIQGIEQGAVGQAAQQNQQDDVVHQVADEGRYVQSQLNHDATPRRAG